MAKIQQRTRKPGFSIHLSEREMDDLGLVLDIYTASGSFEEQTLAFQGTIVTLYEKIVKALL